MSAATSHEVLGRPDADPLAMVGFMLLLAALDIAGTVLAKEWTVHRAAWQLIAGAAAFMALFVVLVAGLRYAEMSILTLGWIVMLQTAVVVIDRARYGTSISVRAVVVMLTILVLQGYLLVNSRSALPPAGSLPAVSLSGAARDQPSAARAAS